MPSNRILCVGFPYVTEVFHESLMECALGLAHILFVANFALEAIHHIVAFACDIGFATISLVQTR